MTRVQSTLSIAALGGIAEIGKNMYVIQYGDDIILVDCGAKFAQKSMLGIDVIIPDFTFIKDNAEKIKGCIVTHGHEDHIGGIPYLLKVCNIPIFASRFTLGLIELKLKEQKLLREAQLTEITAHSHLTFNQITVSFFKTSHSIPDCLGIVFHTPEGNVVHTGDFKFDLTPVNGEVADLHKMAAIGEAGVLVLISESTNAERPGFTPSEQIVAQQLQQQFLMATGKIFISTFASNVHRIQQIIDAAQQTNRKLVFLGRSMETVTTVARKLGYLTISNGLIIDADEVEKLPSNRVVVVCTGSQGEPLAVLARLANGRHRTVKVVPDDTVIFAASPIPGNEKDVSKVVDQFFQLGAQVVYGQASITGLHVSGHGYQEDLKLMLTLMRPKYFIPVHGEYRMLHRHRILAEAVGVKKGRTFILKNGDVVDVFGKIARQTRTITAGDCYVDELGTHAVGSIVLRDRQRLAEDGMLVIVATIRKADGTIVKDPDTISRGFVYAKEAQTFIDDINELAKTALSKFQEAHSFAMKKAIQHVVDQYVYTLTKKSPIILPIIIEV